MAVPASRFIADLGAKKSAGQAQGQATGQEQRSGANQGGAPAKGAGVPQLRVQEPNPAPENLQLFSVHGKNDPEQRVTAAYAKGLEEGRAEAQAQWSRKLDEQRAFHEKQLSVERLTWANREADKLAQQLETAVGRLKTEIADTAAELLRPFLIAAAHQRAMEGLVAALEQLLAKDEGVALEIAGPEDLLHLLRQRLSGKNMAVVFTPAEGPEVRATAGQTVLETQLGLWIAKVEEAYR
jgi:hypothetical protein